MNKSLLVFTILAALVAYTFAAGCITTDADSTPFCKAAFAEMKYKVYDASYPAEKQKEQDAAAQKQFDIYAKNVETVSDACKLAFAKAVCVNFLPKCTKFPTDLAKMACKSLCEAAKTECGATFWGTTDPNTYCSGEEGNCYDGTPGSTGSAGIAKASFALTFIVALIAMLF